MSLDLRPTPSLRFPVRAAVLLGLVLTAGCEGCVEEPTLSRTVDLCLRPGDTLDFGQQLLRTAETRSLAVSNCGNVPIDAVAIVLTPLDEEGAALPEGTESPFLVVETEVQTPLPAGETFTVPIRFRPTAAEVFHAKVTVTVDDALEGEAQLSLLGEGVEAPLCAVSVEPSAVDFGTLLVGESTEASVTISNNGTGECALGGARVKDGEEAFTVTTGPGATLEAGASTTITVSFSPLLEGPQAGTLSVVVDGATELEVPLTGGGELQERCVLAATPEDLIFPRATVTFLETAASATLESVGDVPCTIATVEVSEGAADFSVVSAPAVGDVLAVSDTASLELSFHPSNVGVRSGVLRVTTEEGAVFELPLEGLADPAPSCALTFEPTPLFFDSIGIGLTATKSVTATNISIVDCAIEDVRIGGDGGDFELVTTPAITSLEPGASVSFEVAFTPRLSAPALDELIVDHGAGEASRAELIGFGAYANFHLTPRNEHFGIITEGCVSETFEFELTNVGAVAGRVDEVRFTALSDPNFQILDTVPPGTMLAPGATRTIRARMNSAPVFAGQAAQLEIASTGTVQPRLRATVYGATESLEDADRTDVFTQRERPSVDILFVLDNSGSMSQEQANLANNFSSFISFFTAQADIDYHIGVTTTDVRSSGEQGALVAPYIARTGPNATNDPVAAFIAMTNVGTNGSATEAGLHASALAVEPPNTSPGGANDGFIRSDALLSIVYVTDEEDYSDGAVSEWLDRLLAAKDYRPQALIANAIAGDVPGGCSSPDGDADAAERYLDIVIATDGVFGSICTSDWASVMEEIGLGTFFALTRFQLDRAPDPDTLVVVVNGQVIPHDPVNGWSYNEEDNTIEFNGTSIPDAGADIEVSYTSECILP